MTKHILRYFHCRLLLLAFVAGSSFARLGMAQCANPVVCENELQGNTGWDPGTDDSTIQGFATDISFDVGQTVYFKINTNASSYSINIYRMGYYGGAGARLVATVAPTASLPQSQPACLTDTSTNLVDCGNWTVSGSWSIPSTAVSGIYFADIVRADTGGTSQIFWVVRNDASHSDILFQTSDQTWQAYNPYGGNSLYGGAGTWDLNNRAFKVSYNRPFNTRTFEASSWVYNAEYPMVRWLEANGYDISYFTDIDGVRNASLITNHKLYLSVGHDEYVSGERRTNTKAARDAGVNLAFFSGNEWFWKTRWENSIDGTSTPYRTMVCYKETYYGTSSVYQQDPSDPPTWTGTWRDPRFSPPADGGLPENALTGTIFMVNGPGSDNSNLSITVPASDGQMRFWRNTSVATQGSGQTATLPGGTLGYEWDSDIDNGFRPAGLIPLSTSTYTMTQDLLLDYGGTFGAGNVTHHLTLYRAPSGALVFGGGTVQWAWGLDDNHDGSANPSPDPRMQQATVNLFADMGIQPATLQSGLTAATKSTDTTPPTAVITSPIAGSSVSYGSAITISGTASDTGGGVVGAVEVSLDNGQTWHPATGRSQWSYTWSPWALTGTATISARAIDDSGNIQNPPTSLSFSVGNEPTCPCSIWTNSAAPSTASANDSSSVELGLKFRSDVAGYVTGVRFYKGASNTGVHIGNLWTNQGSHLATVTFTNETASGWQKATFSSPVAISANTTYIISYYAPNGEYAVNSSFFSGNAVNTPPLHALADGVDGANGLYVYATGGGFPISSYNATNYWVDVLFEPSSPGTISGTISGAGGTTLSYSGPVSGSITANSSGAYTISNIPNGAYSITPSQLGYTFTPASQNVTLSGAGITGVNFTATAVSTYTLSGTIAGGAGATVTLTGTGSATTTANSSGNYSFTVVNGSYTVTPSLTGYIFAPTSQNVTVNGANASGANFTATQTLSIWTSSSSPANPSENDSNSVELGVVFKSDVPGNVAGVRFYKGTGNGGTHIGNLWTASGTHLATVTFANETSSGWQQANFSSPVSISANTNYIISYYAPDGHYAADAGFFATAGVDNPPLHALSNSAAGGNGLYLYATGGGFPSSSYNSTNYWVDVVFAPTPTYSISGTITGGSGATVTLTGTAGASVTANSSGNYTFSGLTNGSYTVTPSEAGFSFTPANASVALSGASVTGVNFAATAVPSYTLSGTISGGAGATVTLSGGASTTTTANSSGSYSFSVVNGSYTVTPSLSGDIFTPASQNVTVNGANVSGVNFTTTQTDSIWSSSSTPSNTSENDPNSVELGLVFTSSVAGEVVGVRFYKGPSNTGTHIGNLWTATGTHLATVTFTNETASGWQQASFSSPVSISANTNYVISYYAPSGHYAADSSYFASSGVSTPPLQALSSSAAGGNGVYLYATGGGFPSNTYNSTNYWVDVVFAPTSN